MGAIDIFEKLKEVDGDSMDSKVSLFINRFGLLVYNYSTLLLLTISYMIITFS